MTFAVWRLVFAAAAAAVALTTEIAPAVAEACPNRGQLDVLYCDADHDLVADPPTDPRKWKDPSPLAFAYTPVEDPALYLNAFRPFTRYLSECIGRPVVYYPVQSNLAQIAAVRSGRLHVVGFSTGTTGFAVNLAGAVPFAAKGTAAQIHGYHLIAIVRASSTFRKLSDLKGRRVAHTSPSSNSGNLAPRVLFPPQGLTPDVDYHPLMSGGHDRSALGVMSGDYDMAPVASDVFDRMVRRGTVSGADIRIIYRSPVFPTSSFAYAHDLRPDLIERLKVCFFKFRFPPEMLREFNGSDRFIPITYKEHWAVVREIAEKSGTRYTRAAFENESRWEAATRAAKKKQSPFNK